MQWKDSVVRSRPIQKQPGDMLVDPRLDGQRGMNDWR